jgi:hypothetical protein
MSHKALWGWTSRFFRQERKANEQGGVSKVVEIGFTRLRAFEFCAAQAAWSRG